jgi:hypothetical protein
MENRNAKIEKAKIEKWKRKNRKIEDCKKKKKREKNQTKIKSKSNYIF